MDKPKIIYVKYDDLDNLIDSIKDMMNEYDMELAEHRNGRYTFDRDGSYERTFEIRNNEDGWIVIYDSDNLQTDSFCQELSETLGCFAICAGVYKDMLFYNAINCGVQVGQYMSTLKYYEYPVTDDVVDLYAGDADVFNAVVDSDSIEKLGTLLSDCSSGSIKAAKAFTSMQNILGIAPEYEEDDEEEETEEEDGEPINPEAIFYVDFENINVKIDNNEKVISAIERLAADMGYVRVEDFAENTGKKSLFKKMLSSISESRRLRFYVSPSIDGWVTFVGEIETLHGDQADNWEFIDIADELSMDLHCDVIKLHADSQRWGFNILKDGEMILGYSSDEPYDEEEDFSVLAEMAGEGGDQIAEVLSAGPKDANDIDRTLKNFCGLLNIRNYRINIPMDYTEEEFNTNVIGLLPDGKDFIDLKFKTNK
jgi:hypothetical protein